jgi:hypothetical protein
MSDREGGRRRTKNQAAILREAAELLLELAGVGLLPEEFVEQAESLGTQLNDVADEMTA